MNTPRRIGIVLHNDQFIALGVLRGILNSVAGTPGCSVVGGATPGQAAAVFRRWPPDGVITTFRPRVSLGVPTVAVVYPHSGVPRVAMDDASAGMLAVRHFQERGFRNFAYVGHRGQWWSDTREAGFMSALRSLAPASASPVSRFVTGGFHPGQWQSSSRRLTAWLRGLPRPVAVFASNDTRGREVIDAALTAGLRVPEDVAVLGVDNSDVECEMAHVPESSVIYPVAEVGRRAFETLIRMMDGESVPPAPIWIAPTGIETRLSTDVLAVTDETASAAYRFIRDHAGQPFGVPDVARAVGVARRTLQLRYRRALSRSIHDDIVQARLKLARQLLSDTRLPLKEVASRAGFGSAAYLSKVFRRELHTTPGALRRQSPPR